MRRWPFFLLLALVLELGLAGLAYWQYRTGVDELVAHGQIRQATALEALDRSYAIAAQNVVEQSVQRPGILRLVARAGRRPDERAAVRGELAARLQPVFDVLEENGFRQFHFHLADGTSLYRFHRPERFGDPLFDVRPSVRIAQRERRAVHGFETGRVYHGFRHVFPLVWEGEVVGSVEASVPFATIERLLREIGAEQRHVRLLLERDAVEPKLFADQRGIYRPARVNPAYFLENPGQAEAANSELFARLGERPGVRRQMRSGALFSQVMAYGGRDYSATFVPVRDVTGEDAAYVVTVRENPAISGLRAEALWFFGLGSLPVLVSLLLLGAWLGKRRDLAEESRRLRAIADAMGDGLYVLDAQGRIRFVNTRAAAILGYTEQQLLGREAHPLLHAHSAQGAGDDCPIQAHTFAGERYHSREEGFRRADGRVIPVEVTATPLDNAGGGRGAVTIFRDISGQLEMERRLREQEALFRSIFHATDVGVGLLDAEGRLLRVNEALARMLDRSPEALQGTALGAHVAEGDALAGAMASMGCGEVETRDLELAYRRGDGSRLWVHQSMSLLCDLEGAREQMVVLLADITERKRYERLLKHELRQMDRVLNSAGEGIIGLDAEGRAMFVNAAALRLTGYTRADLEQRRLHDLIHHHCRDGETYAAEDCPILSTLADGRERRVDDELFWRADGEAFPVEYVVAPVDADEGEGAGAVVVFQDITERRRLERELERRATTDALTGALNRERFEALLRAERTRSRRTGAPLSVVMFDIDHFKRVNDHFGHAAGDAVLETLVDRVGGELRDIDSLARWGGEEFMVLLPETDAEGAARLAERLRRRVAGEPFETVGAVSISLGAGQWREGEDEDGFLRRVDDALYAAKAAGRNRVEPAAPPGE